MYAYSDSENAALQSTLADSRAYVERLKGRIDEVMAENAALRAELESLQGSIARERAAKYYDSLEATK